MFVVPNNFL